MEHRSCSVTVGGSGSRWRSSGAEVGCLRRPRAEHLVPAEHGASDDRARVDLGAHACAPVRSGSRASSARTTASPSVAWRWSWALLDRRKKCCSSSQGLVVRDLGAEDVAGARATRRRSGRAHGPFLVRSPARLVSSKPPSSRPMTVIFPSLRVDQRGGKDLAGGSGGSRRRRPRSRLDSPGVGDDLDGPREGHRITEGRGRRPTRSRSADHAEVLTAAVRATSPSAGDRLSTCAGPVEGRWPGISTRSLARAAPRAHLLAAHRFG